MVKTSDKLKKLNDLKDKIVSDNVCEELAKSATQLVFGDGSPDADIVFIGEAPGKNEDLQGLPFVGAAGKFLEEMLAMINLQREDVYITNIVKYRPPNNRDPLPDEKKEFLPYLQTQLDIIQPKLVATLGRHSMNCFLPDLKISQVHGQPKRIRITTDENGSKIARGQISKESAGSQGADGVQGAGEERTEAYRAYAGGALEPATQQSASKRVTVSGFPGKLDALALVILPLFHPAAALYNGGMRQTLIDDFAKIPIIIEKISAADK